MAGITDICVSMWGTDIGYLHLLDNGTIGFQYDSDFLRSGIELSPVKMPLSDVTYSFPALSENTFHGLPGMVADSLPDKFGNAVIVRYLERNGRSGESLSTLEKLCYTGKRGMGALEYKPAIDISVSNSTADIDALSALAQEILTAKENVLLNADSGLISTLMESSSSVGGARAKALIAWNETTNEVRSGQIQAGSGFDYWLLKFGNISNNKDRDATPDAPEYTQIEYAYYLMAKSAGINMSECRLFKSECGSHFMTKRFDRVNGEKIHMQSLGAIAHMDFNAPRTNSYEEAFEVMRKMKISHFDFTELFRRVVFNHFAFNFDDHVKNISFLMNKRGVWTLSPAYDITFSYNPSSLWVSSHQMLINGKAKDINTADLLKVATYADIKAVEAKTIIEQVKSAISQWNSFASQAELSKSTTKRIESIIL